MKAAYRVLLAAPGSGRLLSASLASKLPINAFSVSALLLLSPRYSYAAAGLVIATMLVANAVSSPARGRLADRYSAPAVLGGCLVGYLIGIAGLCVCAAARLPLGLVFASAALIGLSFPPVSILLRGHWVAIAGERGLTAANSVESALMDLTLITGPALAAWLSVAASPFAPFFATSALMAVAVALMSTVRVGPRAPAEHPGDWAGPLRARPLLLVLGALLFFSAALSVIEVVLPIYAQQHQVSGYSGGFLAGLSVGSIVGALVFGPMSSPRRPILPILLGLFVAGALLLGFAMTIGPLVVLAICPLAGLAIGSTFTHLYTAVWTVGPTGYENETQGWATSLTTTGAAAGSAAGAVVAGLTAAPTFVLLSAPTALIAAALVLRARPRRSASLA
ncbi:MFS transporter [Nocardia sp. NPDC060256]|uniref:MFS transporter n=1 Tax=unclassified Nocardia TaxID=2637762 RepID=UPI00364E59F4